MIKPGSKICLAIGAVLSISGASVAQTFPGNVPEGMVGDWDCGDTEAFLTRLGSIELLSETYVAGLFDANEGVFEIEWDDGARATWAYDLAGSDALTLTRGDGVSLDCVRAE